MRIRLATIVGAMLLLAAFGIPGSTAKTGDNTCVTSEVWFDDAEDDGGQVIGGEGGTSGQVAASGYMDLDQFLAAETGENCQNIDFTLTTEDTTSTEPESVTYLVDLQEPENTTIDWTLEFTFGAGEGVTLKEDGTAVTNGTETDGTGTALTITINKTVFGDLHRWDGVEATTSTVNGEPAPLHDTYSMDDASSDLTLIVDYGFDADADGLPDAWEEDTFGDTETSDGNSTTDSDGDGVSDAQEYEDGTDPQDADDCICPEDEEDEEQQEEIPTVTHEDGDGEPGMEDGETLGEGDAYAYTFKEPGVYGFEDGENTDNTMTVTVEEGDHPDGPQTHVVNITDNGFDPSTLTINQNDTVIFANGDGEPHSVVAVEEGDVLSGFEEDGGYILGAAGGTAAVVILSIIALATRWRA